MSPEIKEVELKVENIPLSEIHEDETFNCRGKILPISVVDLTKDIERQGLIQPIILSPYPPETVKFTGKKYRLVAGYRRYTAFKILARQTIPCIIRHDMVDDINARFFNLQENLQRENLDIMQEANTLRSLKDLGIGELEAVERLGKSRGWIQVRYMLLDLPKEVQAEVVNGTVTQPQIRELYTLFHKVGLDACYQAVKDIKDARMKGRIISVNPNKGKKDAARIRKRAEIFVFMEQLQACIGNGIWTRALAWAAGEISDNEIQAYLKVTCEKAGKTYIAPATKDYSEFGEHTTALIN